MAAITMEYQQSPRFDVVEYIKKLRHVGASQELAEVQAQEMVHVIDSILEHTKQQNKQEFVENSKELSTKVDVAAVKHDVVAVKHDVASVKHDVVAVKHDVASVKHDVAIVKRDLREVELRLQKEIEIVRKEIVQSSNRMIIWVFGMMGTFSVFFLSVLAKGFHWI